MISPPTPPPPPPWEFVGGGVDKFLLSGHFFLCNYHIIKNLLAKSVELRNHLDETSLSAIM